MSSDFNAQIKKLLKENRQEAERLIYEHFINKVYALILRSVGNPNVADDLSQEVFIKIFKKISSFNWHSSLSTWIYTITVNTVRDYFRRQKTYRKFLSSWLKKSKVVETQTPEKSMFKNYTENMLNQAIQKLPDSLKEIVLLYYVTNLSIKEIAKVLGMKDSTVKSRLKTARQKLFEMLKDKLN